MNENILISYQNSSSSSTSSSSSSSSSSSLKKTGLNNSKHVNENIANSITQLNKILNTQQVSAQNNNNTTSNDFFYKNYYTRDTNEIQIVSESTRSNGKSSFKENNFIITPPQPPLTRNTSYLVNEKIKQFNATNLNNNYQNRFHSFSNARVLDESKSMMLPLATSAAIVSNGYENLSSNNNSNNSLSLSVLSNISSSFLSSNTHATSSSSPSNEMDDEISFLKNEGVVKTLRKKFSLTNTPSIHNNNNNNISHVDSEEIKSLQSCRSDNNNNNFVNVNNNRKNTNSNRIANIDIGEEFTKEFKFQKLKNLSTSSLDVTNELSNKLKKCQSVKFDASIDADDFLENKESATYESLSEKVHHTSNRLNQKSKSINYLNEPHVYDFTQMEKRPLHRLITKNDSSKLEILSENSKQDESSVFENVDIKEKINKFTSINNYNNNNTTSNELMVSINFNGNKSLTKALKHKHSNSNASSIVSGGEDETDNFSCIISSRTSPNKIIETPRSNIPPVPTKRTICVTTNKNLLCIKTDDNNSSMASNDDTSNDSANSTFSEENGNLLGGDSQANIVVDVVDLKKDLSPISSSSLSLSSSMSMSSRCDLINSKLNFDCVKFEENYLKIKNAFMDLKNDNELIQTLLNDIRSKVQDTLIQINVENNLDGNNNSSNEDEEIIIENIKQLHNENENNTDTNEFYKKSDGTFDNSSHRFFNSPNEQLQLIRHKF